VFVSESSVVVVVRGGNWAFMISLLSSCEFKLVEEVLVILLLPECGGKGTSRFLISIEVWGERPGDTFFDLSKMSILKVKWIKNLVLQKYKNQIWNSSNSLDKK
jgi:hypothetical protein